MILRTLSLLRGQTSVCLRWVRVQSTLLSAVTVDGGARSGLVLKSLSTDIYENLALEDWIHDNVDLQHRGVFLLWRNSPAVVIGRHQNPWQECDLQLMRRTGVPLARRRSGGGTVFHDLGNINMTFFTSKRAYDRHRNLRVVTGALRRLRPALDVQATERFDVLLNGRYKISGTAAKLGRTSAYHHCTLLCCADRGLLSAVLRPTCPGIRSNATASVPSPVKNLLDQDPTLDCDAIMSALAEQYSSEFGPSGPVTLVDPNDELAFPGIHRMARELQTWEWTLGKTPKFSIGTELQLSGRTTARVHVEIKNGIIDSCDVELPPEWLPADVCRDFCEVLTGARFCPNATAVLSAALLRSAARDAEVEERLHQLCRGVASLM